MALDATVLLVIARTDTHTHTTWAGWWFLPTSTRQRAITIGRSRVCDYRKSPEESSSILLAPKGSHVECMSLRIDLPPRGIGKPGLNLISPGARRAASLSQAVLVKTPNKLKRKFYDGTRTCCHSAGSLHGRMRASHSIIPASPSNIPVLIVWRRSQDCSAAVGP